MGCGVDHWAIHGTLENGKMVATSSPVRFDYEENTFETMSGSKYKIVSFSGLEEDFVQQINKDIKSKGYEVY